MTSAVGGNPLLESVYGPRGRLRYHEHNTHKVTKSHFISARPSKQPLMVRTFLKVYVELGLHFLFLHEQMKDIIIIWIRQLEPHDVHEVYVFVCKCVLGSPRSSQPLNSIQPAHLMKMVPYTKAELTLN